MFKTTKAKIIFVAMFSAICIIITTILILYKNIEIEESDENIGEISKNTVEKDVPGIDLNGMYDQNSLKIEEKSISLEQVEIRYVQICGLKNKEIENNINKEIEQLALNCYKEKIKDLNEVVNVHVDITNTANFADTISFVISYYAKIDDNDDGFYQGEQGLNYDLNTGEKIPIEKFFTSDAPIENILRNIAYYSFALDNTETNLSGDIVVSDYGNIEEDIIDFIYAYKKGKITNFFYYPQYLYIIYDENIIELNMEKFSEYIAIYSRYLSTEPLYEDDSIGIKNIYTLADRFIDESFYYYNYQNENNYLIEVIIPHQNSDSDKFAEELFNSKVADIEEEIEKLKQIAAQNPNEFYILNYFININTFDDFDSGQTYTVCDEIGNTYDMTVHDFEENIRPIIQKQNREAISIDDYVYDLSDMLKIEPQNTTEYYNPETGEKIVI